MRPLILASGSSYRAQQLKTLNVDFETDPANIDESALPDELATDLCRRLSCLKARAVAEQHPQALIIGSDQTAELDGRIIGKPGHRDNARAQLQHASGRAVRFFTGLCLLDPSSDKNLTHLDLTTLLFRTLTDAEIERYIQAEHVLDCAGSFKCEGLGISLFETIDTRDPSALIGLPLIALARMLRQCGYSIP